MPPPDCQLCEDTAATLNCKQCQENFCQEVSNPDPLLCSSVHAEARAHLYFSWSIIILLLLHSASMRFTTPASDRATK